MYENAMMIVNLLNALLTPTIAILTANIAWRQYLDGKTRLDLDRYEKRLAVYKAVRTFLSGAVASANVKSRDIMQLRVDTSEASFLFGRDIPDYISELVARGAKLGAANASYRDLNAPVPEPEGYDHAAVCKTMHDESVWMNDQFEEAERKFGRYLNIA
jgi:hypothetical protein